VLVAKIIQANLDDPAIERNSKGFFAVHPLEDSESAERGRQVKDFYLQQGFIPVRSSVDEESGAEEAESNLHYVLTPNAARALVDRVESAAGENIDAVTMGAAIEPGPVSAEEKKGGIDFRSLPIMTQPMTTLQGQSPIKDLPIALTGTVPVISGTVPQFDSELQQIENMVAGGMVPSADRIKDYLDKCCNAGERAFDLEKVLTCLAGIFRLEEDLVASTDPALKDILALVEHNTPVSELKVCLAQIRSASQDVPEVDAFTFEKEEEL
jgi:hypothetical protein